MKSFQLSALMMLTGVTDINAARMPHSLLLSHQVAESLVYDGLQTHFRGG